MLLISVKSFYYTTEFQLPLIQLNKDAPPQAKSNIIVPSDSHYVGPLQTISILNARVCRVIEDLFQVEYIFHPILYVWPPVFVKFEICSCEHQKLWLASHCLGSILFNFVTN